MDRSHHGYAARIGEFVGTIHDELREQSVGNHALPGPVKILDKSGQVFRAGVHRGDHGERVAGRLHQGSVEVRGRNTTRDQHAIMVTATALLPLTLTGLTHPGFLLDTNARDLPD
jgi:hypothetical protein